MATFITTVNFTQQGIQHIAETTKRAEAIKRAGTKMGAKVREIYWTLGPFDGLLIFEAPDDETATAFLLHVGSQGNVTTQTARAFKGAEMKTVLDKLS